MKTNHISLSIIVLAYNEERYIGLCLDAICRQTVQADEVIVVNNNSSDKTADIASSYPFVKVVNESRQGMIPARNTGFSIAKGTLLARIDADTRLPPEWVQQVHAMVDAHADENIGISGPCYFYELPSNGIRRLFSRIHTLAYFKFTHLVLGHNTLFGSNMVITKRSWETVKDDVSDDGKKVHEDINLSMQLAKHGHILFCPELIVGISNRPLYDRLSKKLWRVAAYIRTITMR